jgi:DNA-binding beta-propeller fold protein YncE
MQNRKFHPWSVGILLILVLLICISRGVPADELSPPGIPHHKVLVINDVLRMPSDVAVDGENRIYILDGTADIIRVYDQEGNPLHTIGGSSLLNQPLGIDVSPDGRVLVADSGNHRLVLITPDGSPPLFMSIPLERGYKPFDPTDAAFGLQGEFHAVDNENHRIITFDPSGNLLRATGTMGRNPGEFRFPFLLDLDSDGNLYVVEVINTRLQVLSPEGTHIRFIGDWGIEPGQFFRPKGVALNERNEVYVSDSYLGVIQVFTQDGRFLGVIGDHAGNLIKFTTPMGLNFVNGRLLIVEMFANRIVVLERIAE